MSLLTIMPFLHAKSETLLDHLGVIKVAGRDAKKLLQGQLTCHLDKLKPMTAHFAAHCNPQGRIISFFYLVQHNEETYYLILPSSMQTIALTALKKYAVFYQVNLNIIDNLFLLGIYEDPLAPPSFTQPNDLLIFLPGEPKRSLILRESSKLDAPILQENGGKLAWRVMDLLANIPMIYPETSGKFLPHECQLDQLQAIDYDKGCYTGQEIIARMHYRGKSKWRMFHALLQHNNAALKPGEDIFSGQDKTLKACGYLVDAIRLNEETSLALLLLQEQDAIPQHVHIQGQYFEFDYTFLQNALNTIFPIKR